MEINMNSNNIIVYDKTKAGEITKMGSDKLNEIRSVIISDLRNAKINEILGLKSEKYLLIDSLNTYVVE